MIPNGFGIPARGAGGGGGGGIVPVNAPADGAYLGYDGTDYKWVYTGEEPASIVAGACTLDLQTARSFTATLTGAVAFSLTNTWGNRTFVLILTNSGVVAEPTWPAGSVLWGDGAWDTTDGAENVVVFTWRASGSLGYSIGQQA